MTNRYEDSYCNLQGYSLTLMLNTVATKLDKAQLDRLAALLETPPQEIEKRIADTCREFRP